jgi:hypothetical protein
MPGNHQAQFDAAGNITLVVAKRDPGVYNWIDPGDLREGIRPRVHGQSNCPIGGAVALVSIGDGRDRHCQDRTRYNDYQ